MARKPGKPTAGRKKSRPGAGSKSRPNLAALRALMAMAAGMADGPGGSDLDRAQDKIYDAMEASDRGRRIALAREALAISPLCADAYSILAQEAAKPEEALSLYRQALEAGKQALGKPAFQEDVGHFWGLIETRPYMRALHGLARCLWESGQRVEAVTHYQDLLRLNPNDNQGIRYSLIDAYLELENDGEAAGLLKRYKDDVAAAWAWSGTLLAFRQTGDNDNSRKALARAVKSNPHVPAYLLGRKALPRTLPDFRGMGDDNEAVSYVHDAAGAWAVAEGAKAWVEAVLAGKAPAPSEAKGDQPPAGIQQAEAERIDEAVLALLLLGLHDRFRVWKSFDWEAMARLHEKGFISNPVGRAKSVVLTEEGQRAAEDAYQALFVKGQAAKSQRACERILFAPVAP